MSFGDVDHFSFYSLECFFSFPSSVLVDIEEWGQVIIIGMLTRYARTQFVDPNGGNLTMDEKERPFYDEAEEDESQAKKDDSVLDPDHRLLLRNTRPLLQSRNSSVKPFDFFKKYLDHTKIHYFIT